MGWGHPRGPKGTPRHPRVPKGTQGYPRVPKGTQGRLRRPWGGMGPRGPLGLYRSHSEWKAVSSGRLLRNHSEMKAVASRLKGNGSKCHQNCFRTSGWPWVRNNAHMVPCAPSGQPWARNNQTVVPKLTIPKSVQNRPFWIRFRKVLDGYRFREISRNREEP